MIDLRRYAVVVFLMVAFQFRGIQAQTTALPYIELVRNDVEMTTEIAWNPEGSILALGADDIIWLYSDTLQLLDQLEGHGDIVTSLAWNTDGTRLASGSLDATIRIWNMEAGSNFGTLLTTLEDSSEWVLCVRWSPDGTKLASVLASSRPRPLEISGPFYFYQVWNIASEEVELVLPSYAGSIALAWTHDGIEIVNAGTRMDDNPGVRLWDVATGELQEIFYTAYVNMPNTVSWNSTGDWLAIGTDWGELYVVDRELQVLRLVLNTYASINALGWSPDSIKLASGDHEGGLTIWDAASAQVLAQVRQAHAGVIRSVGWSPLGNKLASVSSIDHKLRIWDVSGLVLPTGVPTATPYPTITPRPSLTPTPQ